MLEMPRIKNKDWSLPSHSCCLKEVDGENSCTEDFTDNVEKQHKVVELDEELNAKSPQEDVETYQESHGDVVTISESLHDAMEDDEDEEDENAEPRDTNLYVGSRIL